MNVWPSLPVQMLPAAITGMDFIWGQISLIILTLAAGTQYLGPQPFAFDRGKMLNGQPATFVSPVGPLGGSIDPFLPSDLDGSRLPPAGAPNSFVGFPGQAT